MGLKEKSPINRPRCRRKETITMVFEKLDGIVWTRFIEHRIRTNSRVMCTDNETAESMTQGEFLTDKLFLKNTSAP